MQRRSPAKLAILVAFFSLRPASAQTSARQLQFILQQHLQPPAIVAYQLTEYLAKKPSKPVLPSSPAEWTAETRRLRQHLLDDVVFHGWPRDWVVAAPKFQDLGVADSGKGYRMRKLRYEIVPGFESTAILYEPAGASGRVPAILNVNGHDPLGKAAEYKQKRCINFAKRGIYALSLEWLSFGELMPGQNGHDHDSAAYLDLAGANGVGLFYLAMRRGLDYLALHPGVDSSRLGVTGLSGGGWQTIVLGALDERVAVAVEVAGFGSIESNLARPIDTDETEEDATDLTADADYTLLVALRAPRPTLLIHNAEDDCCFRAELVKPYIYDAVKPFFKLFGKEDALAWHENMDPSSHNYQLDNRQTAYRFFTQHFNLPVTDHEIPSGSEIKTYEELRVGLPKDNLTILGLARKLAAGIKRDPIPAAGSGRAVWAASERTKLKTVIRYQPTEVKRAWRLNNTKNKGLETLSYRFEFANGLGATAVWAKAMASPSNAPATLMLNDEGKKAAGAEVSDRINRGEQVLALDLLFTGDSAPEKPLPGTYALKLATTGDRPLGLEAAQLVAAANWLRTASDNRPVRLESAGIRSQVAAMLATALEPELFSELVTREGMDSLGHLLDVPIAFRDAPDLFCLDLYKEFDLDRLAVLAEPARLTAK